MSYAIEQLQTRLSALDLAYYKFVTKGDVLPSSANARQNRRKKKDLEEAINKLKN